MDSADPPVRAPARSRLGVGAAIVVVLLALTVTIVIGMVRAAAAPTESVPVDGGATIDGGATVDDGAAADVFYVHVLGAVAAPGLYLVAGGARVVDAVAAAGGFTASADRGAVNLARPVGDGEQLYVPALGEAPAATGGTTMGDGTTPGAGPAVGAGGSGAAAGDGRVNLNTADAAALDTLPRIGPAMAERILQWREDNGRFTSVDDLLAVPGIGEKMLESLRDLVTV